MLKTARMFRHAARLVGVHALRPPNQKTQTALEILALLYQIVDDWVDTVGVPAMTNKHSGRDVANNVHSFMRAKWNFALSGVIGGTIPGSSDAFNATAKIIASIDVALRPNRCLADLSLSSSRDVLLALCSAIRSEIRTVMPAEGEESSVCYDVLGEIEDGICRVKIDDSSHFQIIAHQYERLRPSNPHMIQVLSDVLALSTNQRVVDLGCGTGQDLAAMRERFGIRPVGVDSAEAMVRIARLRLGSRCVYCCDVVDFLGAERDRFDAAILKFSAHHIHRTDALLAGLHRALVPGGRVAIVTMLPQQVRQFVLTQYFPTLRAVMIEAAMKQERMLRDLLASGFKLVTVCNCDIEELAWDSSLLEAVDRRFISFLNKVPEAEFAEGRHRLRCDLQSRERTISIECTLICACTSKRVWKGCVV